MSFSRGSSWARDQTQESCIARRYCWTTRETPIMEYCSCSVAQLSPTLCNPMDCSLSGYPVLHHLPELAQTHVHWMVGCHPTILSSVIPFSSCLQSFPGSGLFPVNQLFTSGHQSTRASTSTSVPPMNIQDWFPLRLTDSQSPCSPRDSWESSPAPQLNSINSLVLSLLYGPILTFIHDYWKNHSFD